MNRNNGCGCLVALLLIGLALVYGCAATGHALQMPSVIHREPFAEDSTVCYWYSGGGGVSCLYNPAAFRHAAQ